MTRPLRRLPGGSCAWLCNSPSDLGCLPEGSTFYEPTGLTGYVLPHKLLTSRLKWQRPLGPTLTNLPRGRPQACPSHCRSQEPAQHHVLQTPQPPKQSMMGRWRTKASQPSIP